VFVVVSGTAEVSVSGQLGPRLVSVLRAGDFFGVLALFPPEGRRTATVTAATELVLLALPCEELRRRFVEDPSLEETLRAHASELLTASFLGRVGPFVRLDADLRRRVAARVKRTHVLAGAAVVRQGEIGDSCFIVQSGRLKVTVTRDGETRDAGVLGVADIFGETALLTSSPRGATVTALEPTVLLELERDAISDVLGWHAAAGAELVRLMRLRERPRQRAGVEVAEQVNAAGERLAILKLPVELRYFRLSERGRFVWDRIDG